MAIRLTVPYSEWSSSTDDTSCLTKMLSKLLLWPSFLTNLFVLLAADVPETLLVFRQVTRHFHTLSTIHKTRVLNMTTNGSSFLWGDCGRRGWYDSPQSALRPHTGVTQCALVRNVCKFVCGWMVHDSVKRQVSCVGGTLMLYVSSAQPPLFYFSRRRPSVHHAYSR